MTSWPVVELDGVTAVIVGEFSCTVARASADTPDTEAA